MFGFPVERIVALVLLAMFVLPLPASAQSWFTKEACTVTAPDIDPSAIDEALMADIAAGAARIENGVGRFWRITSPDGAISHLWGTYHSNDPLMLDLPDKLRATLRRARVVAPEYDAVADSRRVLDTMRRGEGFYAKKYEPAKFLHLDQRVIKWADLRLRSLGYADGTLSIFTPAGLALMLMGDPCNDFAHSVYPTQDHRIQLLGVEAGARVVGLEPLDAMIKTLGREDRREITTAIIEAYGSHLDPEKMQAGRRTAFAFYLQGRIAEAMVWDRLSLADFFGLKRGAEILRRMDGYLVVERNRNFLELAVALLKEGGAVIAVGAFHLPGPNGLVSLFRKAGFSVERVPTEGEVPTPP